MKLASVVRPALIIAIVSMPGVARAQDDPKVGLTMGYPSSVGVIWNVSERVAVRPEVGLSRMTGDATGFDAAGQAPISTNDSTGVGVGISGLIYVGRWDALRAYVSPRVSYVRTSASASTSSSSSYSDSLSSSYLTSGSFGAQYSLGRHFGLFGEIGVGYSTTTTALTSTLSTGIIVLVGGIPSLSTTTRLVTSSAHASSLATRSGVGVIFFF
jgi:hypothetical protein